MTPGVTPSFALWRDRRGRVSALRIGVLAFLALPVALAAHAFLTAGLGARPINDLIHRTGYWALVFLLVTLAVTPLARIGRFNGLIDVRRMLGVGACIYAAVHILCLLPIRCSTFSRSQLKSCCGSISPSASLRCWD